MAMNRTRSITPAPALSSTSLDTRPNSISVLSQRVSQGYLGWKWPLVFCFLRLPLFLGSFVIALLVYKLAGHPLAFSLAQGIVIYDGPVLVDVLCLLLLAYVVQKEGGRLRDLINFSRKHILRDTALGIGLFMFIYMLVFAFSVGTLVLIAGPAFLSAQTAQSLLTNTGMNPFGLPWHIIIDVILLPITTGCVEEMLYRGYVQPRLRVLTGSTWIALLVMALGFGLQHIAFGLTSWQFALSGFLITFVIGLIFGIMNLLNRQRLLPLILIHWQANVISLGLAPLLLIIFVKGP